MRERFDKPADYLYSLKRMGVKLGLDKIRDFLEEFDHPQKDFDSILIAGTNGKGSVARITSEILQRSGYRTGLYISPHLLQFEDRMRVNGESVPRETLWELIEEVDPVVKKIEEEDAEKRPSFFEVLTTLAFMYFSEQDIDVAVLEVGMGGRLDATNVVDNTASVVTTIGMDHSEYLGSTKMDIAYEKAGVIKEDNVFVTEEKEEEIREYLESVCQERGADYNHALERRYEILKTPLRLKLPDYGEVEVPGRTSWQAENALTALTLAEDLKNRGYNISSDDIVNALKQTVLLARMEIVLEEPTIMMDSAHNPSGMRALIEGLKHSSVEYDRLLLVMGVLEDKDYADIVEELDPHCDKAFLGEPVSERKLSSDELADEFSVFTKMETYTEGIKALKAAMDEWKPGDLILVTGSIYFLGDVRRAGKDELW